MRQNATRYVILGLLTEGPLTGYDIKKQVSLRFQFFWNESYGQIYPELKKLTQEEMVELLPESQDEGGRPKKRYRITEAGFRAFEKWMTIAPEGEKVRYEFLLKVYWAPHLAPDRVGEYVRDFMKRHKCELDMLRRMETDIIPGISDRGSDWWVLQTIRLGRRVNEAYLAWASELLTEMEGLGDEDR